MPRRLLTLEPIRPELGISLIRILAGLLMTYHGTEIFQPEAMARNAQFLADTHFPAAGILAWRYFPSWLPCCSSPDPAASAWMPGGQEKGS